MNWTQTREKLIAAGIDPARLPDEWKSNINLRDANLSGADLSAATLNWNSHDLLAELAIRAAGNDYRRRMDAGLILVSRDWRWDKFIAVLDSDTQDWFGSVFAPYVKDGDGAPVIVRQYVKVEAQP